MVALVAGLLPVFSRLYIAAPYRCGTVVAGLPLGPAAALGGWALRRLLSALTRGLRPAGASSSISPAAQAPVVAQPRQAGPMSTPREPAPSRRLALGTGAALGAGALLGAAGCSSPHPSGSAATRQAATEASTPSRSATPADPTPPATPSPTSTAAIAAAPPSVAAVRGPDIVHGPRSRDEVALTFHRQGAAALTDAVLRACRAASAAVTVFAVGTWVQGDPSQAIALQREGHEVGSHTWSHQPMRRLSASAARTEVRRGRDELTRALGGAGWWFRPSGTPHSTATIRSAAWAAGYARCVSYDVDPQDYLDPGAGAVRSRVRRAVRAGSIVSLHLGHAGTAEALPGILPDLARTGLQPVTLSRRLRD